MSNDTLYLKSSTFYNSNAWAKFITDGFMPFIRRYPTAPYFFTLAKEPGHNIRLAIALNTREFEIAAQDLHQHLGDFLKTNPSANTPVNNQCLFENFPNNSIRYNLFEHESFLIEFQDQKLNMDKFISDFWNLLANMERSSLEQIMANRYAFALQLFVTLLFCFSENEKQAFKIVDHIVTKFYTNDILLQSASETESSDLNVSILFDETWKTLKADDGYNNSLFLFKSLFKKISATTSTLKKYDQRSRIVYLTFTKLHTDLGIRDKTIIADFYKKGAEFFSNNIT